MNEDQSISNGGYDWLNECLNLFEIIELKPMTLRAIRKLKPKLAIFPFRKFIINRKLNRAKNPQIFRGFSKHLRKL